MLGGVLVEVASWHWIFLINIPFGVLGVMLALRWWPETWDLSAGRQVDVRGMLLLGGAVLFLTVALVEANPFGGDLPLWLTLMQGAILLGVAFVWWERRAPNPMITPALIANRQFRNANIGMLFFAAGRDRLAAAALARVHEPVGLHADRGGARARAGAALRPDRVAVRRHGRPTSARPARSPSRR